MPDPLVAIWIVPVELENVPLCPLPPGLAVKFTLYEGMTTELASFTVADRAVVNAVFIVADWLLPPLTVRLAGIWITVAVSVAVAAVAELVWVRSPPPHAFAVLLTETGEAAGTFTVRVMTEFAPPDIPAVVAQVTVLVPLQLHVPVDVYELSV